VPRNDAGKCTRTKNSFTIAFPSNVVCELPCSLVVARDEVGEVDTEGMILPVRKYDKQEGAGIRPSRVPRKRFLF